MIDNCKIKVIVYDNTNNELGSSRMIDFSEIVHSQYDYNILGNEINNVFKKIDNKENRKNNPHHYSNRVD